MDNQARHSNELPHTQHHGAHSGFRSGLSDYNDGGELTHYGGNDDYSREKKKGDKSQDESEDLGRVAYGNDNEVEKNDFGKFHSGL